MSDRAQIVKQYILSRAAGVLKAPCGKLKHPFIDPGAGYAGELWDWDSYFTAYALCKIREKCTQKEAADAGLSDGDISPHVTGSILNFLNAQEPDGYTPVMVAGGGLFDGYFKREYDKGVPLNQHKPFLCQAALQAAERFGGIDGAIADKLVKYLGYYENNQYDEKSGLFFWQDDIMIGIDNNPTVFFRPPRTCADIYLNGFLYAEYVALAQILEKLGDDRSAIAAEKAEKLKTAVNREMWDERDGIYYSQDLGFYRAARKIGDFEFHAGQTPSWRTVPLKIRFWGCFVPLYTGIADACRAARLCEHLCDDDVFAKYGIRTLARNEKMYDLGKTSNPSNWLGAVWTVPNFIVYKGLLRYGLTDMADKLKDATIELLSFNITKHGDMFESYQPDTGEPNLHAGFLSFNLLALEML